MTDFTEQLHNNYVIQNRITVTVVIPVYNVSPYVERCIQSVINQTYPAMECIIVDDFSTDDSIARCQRLLDNYKGDTQFVIFHHSKNRGLSAARNTGTDAASSDYIYYLDSDDEITPDCLEKLVNPILHDDSIEMVMGDNSSDYSMMPGAKNRVKQWLGSLHDNQGFFSESDKLVLKNNDEISKWFYGTKQTRPFYVWNKLIKLSFIKKHQLYNKEGLLWEDMLWTFYTIRCLHRVAVVSDKTYTQHFRPESIQTRVKYGEMLIHYGYTFRVIAEHFVRGERMEETLYWFRLFCSHYVNAHKNPDYKYAFNAFMMQFSDGKHKREVQRLKILRFVAKHRGGRILYNGAKRTTRIVKKFIRLESEGRKD